MTMSWGRENLGFKGEETTIKGEGEKEEKVGEGVELTVHRRKFWDCIGFCSPLVMGKRNVYLLTAICTILQNNK